MSDEHKGITVADIKGLLVWTPIIGALAYGIVMWTKSQERDAYFDGRLTAMESLVSVTAIRENAIWKTNIERDIRELRAGQGGMVCAPRDGLLVCLPRGARE